MTNMKQSEMESADDFDDEMDSLDFKSLALISGKVLLTQP